MYARNRAVESLLINQGIKMTKKKILENIHRQQQDSLERLKLSITNVKEEAERVLKKIEKDGPEGYYSCNSPLHDWVNQAWKASGTLSELRRMQGCFEEKERLKKKAAKTVS